MIQPDTWVEIEQTILNAGERAPQVPEDTAKTPLWLKAKGWLLAPGSLGAQVEIVSATGRILRGRLVAVNPSYQHGFGRPVPELLPVGRELRALLEENNGQ